MRECVRVCMCVYVYIEEKKKESFSIWWLAYDLWVL